MTREMNVTRQNRYPTWRQIPGTYSLITVTVLWYFIIESINGHSIVGLTNAGAMAGALVKSGDWYRLVSSIFVHLSTIHLLLNMLSLWSLYLVELVFGTRAFLVLYGIAGITGNIISLWLMDPYALTAGASGAVFGVFGAIFALSFQGVLNKTVRNQLILLLVANLIFDFSHPDINLVAHLGGFSVGILFTWVYKRFRFARTFWTIGAYSMVFVFTVGLIGTKFYQ